MKRLLYGHDKEVAAWVAERLPHVDDFGPCAAIGVVEDDELIGGIVYHDYLPTFATMQASIATTTPRWVSRGILYGILAYPFVQLRLRRLTALTGHRNGRAIRFLTGIGFKREGTMRAAFGDQHAAVFGLLRQDVPRWIGLDLKKVA